MITEPVGGSVEGDDYGSVQEPVEHRGGDGSVAEDLTPGSDGPVRGDHDRRFQVVLVDDLEQSRRGLSRKRQIPKCDGLSRLLEGTTTHQPVPTHPMNLYSL